MKFEQLPDDILQRISQEYEWHNSLLITSILSCLYSKRAVNNFGLGVIRSALYLANGDIEKLLSELNCEYRDILVSAEEASGWRGHYFRIPFPEIEKLEELTGKTGVKELSEYEALPNEFWNSNEANEKQLVKVKLDLLLRGGNNKGYSDAEIYDVFGDSIKNLPFSYKWFLREMGKKSQIFTGEDYDIYDLSSYKEDVYNTFRMHPKIDQIKLQIDKYVIFLSSQGCNWLMFKKECKFDPPVYLLKGDRFEPVKTSDSFSELICSRIKYKQTL